MTRQDAEDKSLPGSEENTEPIRDERSRTLLAANLALFFASYVLAGGLGQGLAIIPGIDITIWPPAGIFVAVLLLNSRKTWSAYVIVACLAELTCNAIWFGNPGFNAILYFLANGLVALFFAFMVHRLAKKPYRFESFEDIGIFVLAALTSPVLGATVIAGIDQAVGKHAFTTTWPLVWLGDSTGLLVTAPLALVLIQAFRRRAHILPSRALETLAVLTLIVCIEALSVRDFSPTAYLTMPLVLWLAVRFQIRGAAVGIAFVALTTAIFTMGWRPEGDAAAIKEKMMMLQTYLGVIATSALVAAALSHQNAESVEALKKANAELEDRVEERTRAIRASEAHLGAIYDSAPLFIGITEPGEDDILHHYDNPAATAFFGVEPGATANKWVVRDLGADPEIAKVWLEKYNESARTGKPVTIEHPVPRPEGTAWIRATIAPIGQGENGRTRFCYVAEDVSTRRLADESSLRLAAVVQSSADAILSKNLDGIVTSWNASAERMFGYTADEMVGASILQLIPEELRSEEEVIISKLKRGETIDHFETVRMAKNGTRIEVSLSISPLRNAQGETIGASKIVRDISDRKRAEEVLIEIDRRKDEFLATLAHELRNPLAPLQSGLEVLERGPTPAQAEVVLGSMSRQVTHLVHLVDDLLDVARVRSGKIALRDEIVSLRGAITSAIDATSSAVAAGNHELKIDLGPQDLVVKGDETRIVQIVANMLTNAAKYTDPGGKISVSLSAREKFAEIAVTDNGVGIAPELLPTIWDMFSQVRDTIEKAQGGLGIGLSLVKRLADLHGGSVEVSSPGLGQGSTFRILLPLSNASEPTPSLPAKPETNAVSRHILVVDDNRDVARMMSLLLEMHGHSVDTAYTGQEALEKALAHPPQIILCDIGIPDIDGYEIARRLRAEPSLDQTILVAVTGWGREEDRQASFGAGFHEHLTKPVEYVDIERLLKRPS